MENLVKEKSYKFALRVINLYKYIAETKKEFVLSNKFLDVVLQLVLILKKRLEDNQKKILSLKCLLAIRKHVKHIIG